MGKKGGIFFLGNKIIFSSVNMLGNKFGFKQAPWGFFFSHACALSIRGNLPVLRPASHNWALLPLCFFGIMHAGGFLNTSGERSFHKGQGAVRRG